MSDEDDYRIEADSLGEMRVPTDAYWGTDATCHRELPISESPSGDGSSVHSAS